MNISKLRDERRNLDARATKANRDRHALFVEAPVGGKKSLKAAHDALAGLAGQYTIFKLVEGA